MATFPWKQIRGDRSPVADRTLPSRLRAVPAWFAALVRPEIDERKARVVARHGEPIVILGEPVDEIAEA